MKITITILLMLSLSANASPLLPDFQAISKSNITFMGTPHDRIILETANHYIVKSPLTNFESFDYYYLQLPKNSRQHSWYLQNTNVVLEEPGEFLIVEVRNENQLLELASQAHHDGSACGMIQKLSSMPVDLHKQDAPERVQSKQADVSDAVAKVKIANILETVQTMVSWQTRYEGLAQGEDTAEKLQIMYQDLTPADRADVSIQLVNHRGTSQPSIVVRIEGDQQPEKLVILGSHIDSINQNNNGNAPGADDNASGTATNLEVFRVLMASGFRPRHSIEIHGYAAEEIGLVGSKEIAESYKKQNKQVLAMVQFDMNGYASGEPKITFVSNGTTSNLTRQLQELAKMYNSIPATTGFLMFGSSDHASWSRQGFPVAFPTEDPFRFNNAIHTADDTLDKMNSPKQTEEFGKLGVAYLMHFAK